MGGGPDPGHGSGGKVDIGDGCKLFIGNLNPSIADGDLKYVFSTYGDVQNIHIMAGKSTSGQSCAFVSYSSPAEAASAIATLHEKYEIRPGDGNIMVKYAPGGNRSKPY